MVLTPTLSKEQMKRHELLINRYFAERGKSLSIKYHHNGSKKGIYKVETQGSTFIAVAAAIDSSSDLLQEYRLLCELYNGAQFFFPRPFAHYSSDQGQLIIMEFLPHQQIGEFPKYPFSKPGGFFKEFAYMFGFSLTSVNINTGYFPSEPHDGNILVKADEESNLELKFCDAIQFQRGSLEVALSNALLSGFRDESKRFIIQFRQGVIRALKELQEKDEATCKRELEFLKNINDVF